MIVRAKFKVIEFTRREGWSGNKEIHGIKLHPVTGGSEENKSFFAATPSGTIELCCCNPDAVNQFELGKEYYVDFTPA